MKRILAWAGIFIIAAAFITLLILTFTGAPANQIVALLFGLLIIPVFLYAFLLIVRVGRSKHGRETTDTNEND
ncbi:MAG: DUF2207 domain-containing protein [Lachnospiraceae bacterium]|nr:DUF2207 domain-containing protein [Lachnospiraceae bacterium]